MGQKTWNEIHAISKLNSEGTSNRNDRMVVEEHLKREKLGSSQNESVEKEKFSATFREKRNSNSTSNSKTILALLSAAFVLTLIATIMCCVVLSVNSIVSSNLETTNNTQAYELDNSPRVEPLIKVYLYNYTNWEKVRSGTALLNANFVGPYVFKQQLNQFEEDNVTLSPAESYKFLRDKSYGSIEEQAVFPNIPLLGLLQTAQNLDALSEIYLSSIINMGYQPDAFVRLPINKFLFGYEEKNEYYINIRKTFLSNRIDKSELDVYGLLAARRDLLSNKITTKPADDADDGGGERRFCYSYKEFTNDSAFLPSQMDKRSFLFVIFPELCTVVPFLYNMDIQMDNITLHRYRPASPIDIPTCTCDHDKVIIPHFHLCNLPLLGSNVAPEVKLLESYLDINPIGVILRKKIMFYVSVEVPKLNRFNVLKYLPKKQHLPVGMIEAEYIDQELRRSKQNNFQIPPSNKVYGSRLTEEKARLFAKIIPSFGRHDMPLFPDNTYYR